MNFSDQVLEIADKARQDIESKLGDNPLTLSDADQLSVIVENLCGSVTEIAVAEIDADGVKDDKGHYWEFADLFPYDICRLADLVNEHKIKEWFSGLELEDLESIFVRPSGMDANDFIDFCDDTWLKYADKEKQELYEQYN